MRRRSSALASPLLQRSSAPAPPLLRRSSAPAPPLLRAPAPPISPPDLHAHEAAEACVLIYCCSSTNISDLRIKIISRWTNYLHDKPNANNCPKRIYDALVNALDS
ncbi:hypothetical protein U9M48_028757 [Paspalum notatum var. saurae]|uniref:Uncharacterized protein n=1 Tax=Paspalum notatum var. saurae TaxID=547442 RepID=A0AAQ3X1R0_PASNO